MIAANDPERAGQQLEVSASRMAVGGSPYLRDIRDTAVGSFLGGQLLRAPMSVLSAVEELALCRESASRSVMLYAKARDLELSAPRRRKVFSDGRSRWCSHARAIANDRRND